MTLKVGDRVHNRRAGYGTIASTRETRHGPMYPISVKWDDDNGRIHDGWSEASLTLVEPPRRLYQAGDKVLVEYTVTRTQRYPGQKDIEVTYPGIKADRATRLAYILDAGTLTPAPEKPYVPKVGDRFTVNVLIGDCECLYADSESIFVMVNNSRRTWFNVRDSSYNFKKLA